MHGILKMHILTQGVLDRVLEESRLTVEKLRREHRIRDKERRQEMHELLKGMHEDGKSLGDVRSMKKECKAELEKTRMNDKVRKNWIGKRICRGYGSVVI